MDGATWIFGIRIYLQDVGGLPDIFVSDPVLIHVWNWLTFDSDIVDMKVEYNWTFGSEIFDLLSMG